MKFNKKTFYTICRYFIATAILILFSFELWVILLNKFTDTGRPANLGNFEANIAALQNESPGEKFRFVVIGDSRSEGTFEQIAQNISDYSISFGVLLGDIAFTGSKDEHRWLRSEINTDWHLDFPLFYLIGNHDIRYKGYPISLFEKEYGSSIFSFEYGDCLFVFLRVWNAYDEDYQESIDFLKDLSKKDLSRYRKRFVFMHQPPTVSTLSPVTEFAKSDEFNRLFKKMKIDYVFASDFHGYAWTKQNGIIYNITGGAGAKLVPTIPKQFHHVLVMEVGKDYVSQQFVVANKDFDFEDHIKRFAFVSIWPLFRDHPYLSITFNLCFLLILSGVFIANHKSKHAKVTLE